MDRPTDAGSRRRVRARDASGRHCRIGHGIHAGNVKCRRNSAAGAASSDSGLAVGIDANPAVFALTMAIATSNSFLIPNHQVNALIMGPAGHRVADFIKAGGIVTALFLVVSLAVLNLVF